MVLSAGSMLDERLRLVEPIHRGDAASVWLASDVTDGNVVAVKLISPEQLVDDPVALERFAREGVATARVASRHVVRVLRHGTSRAGIPYIVMERLLGESLAARLEREGRLAPEVVAEVVADLGRGLADIHAEGIVHRDLQPSNVLSSDEGGALVCKLLDFGVAKVTRRASAGDASAREDLTLPGKLIGSPAYLSPEQVSARPVTPMLDLWSLAVIAYQALTGKLPFGGDAPAKVFTAILQTRHAPPSALVPELPPEVDAFFLRAFHRDPSQRFLSGPELAAALGAALAPLAQARAAAAAAAR
ncbi:MAG: serine/threonine protein kinase, partial [Myxococcales bacterium]|nr:serine/threonine protein kinase [Myxococcales bacterium]